MLISIRKEGFTYSADGRQFKFDCIKNFFISVNNPKTTKDDAKIFLETYIVNEMQDISKKYPRGQVNEKQTMLKIYKSVAGVFTPLFKWDTEQSKLETQKSDDEQLNTSDMPELEGEESAAQEQQSAKGLKLLTSSQMLGRLPIF